MNTIELLALHCASYRPEDLVSDWMKSRTPPPHTFAHNSAECPQKAYLPTTATPSEVGHVGTSASLPKALLVQSK